MSNPTSRGISLDELDNPNQQKRTNHLLAIGIDDYLHCPKLFNCKKDVEDLIEVLTSRFLFEEEHVTTLFNKEAKRGKIYKAFRRMAEKITPNDNLIIYFSGHGEYDKIFNQGYWIPVNAQEGEHDQYIPNSEIRTFLSAIKSHHTFLISDSCFSGALFAKGLGKNVSRRYEKDPSRWGLTAGRNEIVSDGKPGDNSPFAESLLYRLRNSEQGIGVAELCSQITEYVQANSDQSPIGEPLKVEGHKNGQFFFQLKNQKSKSELLWEKIENSSSDTIAEIEQKILLIKEYLKKHKDEGNFSEAIELGKLLEQKHQFFKAKDSYFSLAEFVEKETLFKENATILLRTMESSKTEANLILSTKRTPKNKEIQGYFKIGTLVDLLILLALFMSVSIALYLAFISSS